jgi:chemotaxis protein methyltransferase CheR
MTVDLSPQEFFLLSQFIEQQSGIVLKENKAYLIKNRLSHLVSEYNCRSFAELYFRLRNEPFGSPMVTSLVDAITTGETSWFRDGHPFRVLRDSLIPRHRQEIVDGRRSRIEILSIGCSTGQEPYSIAMSAFDAFSAHGGAKACSEQVRILALDISKTCLAAARRAEYDHVAMKRGLSPEYRDRYFRRSERGTWFVRDSVRNLVRFQSFNIGQKQWDLGFFDIVFLRNVVIYFSDTAKFAIFDKTARIMKPGAFLFLGTGETVSGYTTLFEILEDEGAMYYRFEKGN